MALGRFFRLPRSREFNYIPRYYDEQKEDLQNRIEKIEAEIKADENSTEGKRRNRISKGQMHEYFAQSRTRRTKKMSNIRLLVILALLVLILYYLLYL